MSSYENFAKQRFNKLMSVVPVRELPADGTRIKTAEERGYSFFFDKSETAIIVDKAGRYLRLSVPRYGHRPFKAHWINSKLLYLEQSFNPHYGAYWIFDVERERIVTHELTDDGYKAYEKCLNKTRQ